MAITKAAVLVGIGTFSVDGADVGSTRNGVNCTMQLDMYEKEVDQFLATLDLVPTKVGMTVDTEIAEATQENVRTAWNVKNAPAGASPAKTLKLGVNTVSAEHTLSFLGRAPTGGLRTFAIFRAGVMGSSQMGIKKNDQVGLPSSFVCLPDLAKAEGDEFGTIIE